MTVITKAILDRRYDAAKWQWHVVLPDSSSLPAGDCAAFSETSGLAALPLDTLISLAIREGLLDEYLARGIRPNSAGLP